MAKERVLNLSQQQLDQLLTGYLSRLSPEEIATDKLGKKLVLARFPSMQKESFTRLTTQEQRERITDKLVEFAEKSDIKIGERSARAEINVAEVGLLEEEKRAGRARGEVAAERIREQARLEAERLDPRRQAALDAEQQIMDRIRSSRADRLATEADVELAAQRSIPLDAPNRTEVTDRLKTFATTERTALASEAVRLAERKGIPAEVARPPILELQGKGELLFQKSGKASKPLELALSRMEQSVPQLRAIQRLAEDAGLRATGDLNALQFEELRRPKILEGGPRQTFAKVLESAGRDIAGGAGEGAVARATEASKAMRTSTTLRRLGGAGGIAALLLPSIISAFKGREERQQSPAEQIQLLQALSQLQQNEKLGQSLVDSRQSQAALNLAKAQMLQLQAAGAGGGRQLVL